MLADQVIFMSTGTLMLFMGIAFIVYSRNLVKTMMSLQVAVFGVNLALFAAGLGGGGDGRLPSDTLVLLSLLAGASVEAVGLAIVVTVYRRYGTLDPREIRRLRG